ncbi:MAG: hypothetical protein EOP83_07935 [Verrucomicrobiaceae bacterium]|nr:MAG: hypothetical protein EOP83_07935 [Verrucomicrobiaceae bacterium]
MSQNMRDLMRLVESQQLDELQGVKGHAQAAAPLDSHDAVIDYLESKGFKRLGDGEYGGVFDHPSFKGRYVLKVFRDPMYEAFLGYCAKHPQNPHLPKIVGKVMPIGKLAHMVRIERLQDMPKQLFVNLKLDRIVASLEWPPTSHPEQMALQNAIQQGNLHSLYTTLMSLTQAKPGRGRIDLHYGNFMLRGETIVISDPYAGAKTVFKREY